MGWRATPMGEELQECRPALCQSRLVSPNREEGMLRLSLGPPACRFTTAMDSLTSCPEEQACP